MFIGCSLGVVICNRERERAKFHCTVYTVVSNQDQNISPTHTTVKQAFLYATKPVVSGLEPNAIRHCSIRYSLMHHDHSVGRWAGYI